jgi:DNA-binding response OmpR family regulator
MRLLLIEDDHRIALNIKKVLDSKGYTVDTVFTGEDGLFHAETQGYDCIILDWMLPDIAGVEVCRALRRKAVSAPVLFLTAKTQAEDVVQGLDAGADDYLAKPFAMEVLIARIKALIRRKIGGSPSVQLKMKDLILDTNKNTATMRGKALDLAPKEYALLEYLITHRCKALDRMNIMEHVWGETIDEFSNTVDVHIRYLRRKIDEPYGTHYIQTIKNKGYMICET